MSKASIRRHASGIRIARRMRSILRHSKRGRLLLVQTKSFGALGLHLKIYDVDQVVDVCISERNATYVPARDSAKFMCTNLLICQGEMGQFLLEVDNKLKPRGWTFTFDDAFVDKAVSQKVVELKGSISDATR